MKKVKIEIMGAGCEKYFCILHTIHNVVKKEKIPAEIIEITDKKRIINKGITNMPAVLINDVLIFQGEVLKEEDIKKILLSI